MFASRIARTRWDGRLSSSTGDEFGTDRPGAPARPHAAGEPDFGPVAGDLASIGASSGSLDNVSPRDSGAEQSWWCRLLSVGAWFGH